MKKILLIFLFFNNISYAENLPFVGSIYDAPHLGNAFSVHFEIKEDNMLVITICGKTNCSIEYEGGYQSKIQTEYGGYLFTEDKIYYLDTEGNKMRANSEDCYANLLQGDLYCEVNLN